MTRDASGINHVAGVAAGGVAARWPSDGRLPACRRAAAVPRHDAEGTPATPADGRLLVILSKDPTPRAAACRSRRTSQHPADVRDRTSTEWRQTKPPCSTPARSAIPSRLSTQIPPGEYNVQAVLNVYETFHRKDGHVVKGAMDQWEGQQWNTKPGNLYSEPRQMWIDPAASGTIALIARQGDSGDAVSEGHANT